MPWQPLPRIAFAVATYPFAPTDPADLPLEIGDELYIIEETPDGNWLRGYLVAPPSLLAGLTSVKGQTLEARVFSGIFPRSCVEVREVLGENDSSEDDHSENGAEDRRRGGGGRGGDVQHVGSDSGKSGLAGDEKRRRKDRVKAPEISIVGLGGDKAGAKGIPKSAKGLLSGTHGRLSVPVKRDRNAPRPAAPVPMLKIGDETPTSASEPLIDEIASCLREWHSTNLHGLLLSGQYHELDKLSQLVTSLNFSRQQFLHNVLTTWEFDHLREQTVWDLVRVNKLCGGEVIVRDPRERGRVLTGDDSVVEVTQLQSVMSLLDEPPQPTVELTALHHLLVDLRGFAGASAEPTTLQVYLVSKPASGPVVTLSESYIIEIPPGGMIGAKSLQARTLFTDLAASDIGDAPSVDDSELLLVLKVRATQPVLLAAAAAKPGSRSASYSQGSRPRSKDGSSKPPLSSGGKSVRRSLMWAAGKSTRSAFSRGNPKLDALSEQPEERPPTDGHDSSDEAPPSTATSRGGQRVSIDRPVATTTAERIIGVGALRLNAIMKREEDVEQLVPIWSPSERFSSEKQSGGEDYYWEPLICDLMNSKSGQFDKPAGAERLQVHLRPFNSPDADVLIKATPTLLSGVNKTNRMGFSGAPTKPRSDIYVTIDEATISRQTLLSRYGGSATSMPSSMHGNNLQVTLEVRRPSGERIENCIFPSSNSEGMGSFRTVAVDKGSSGGWRQTVRLLINPQDVFSAHIALFLADVPGQPFAVAHIPLWDQQAFVKDGAHALLLYKIDEYTATPKPNATGRGGYLTVPWAARGKGEGAAEVTGPLATLRLNTYLCSTRFSQDRVVLGLLKWKDRPRDNIPNMLKQLIFVPEIEVVKLLSDVLDALFGILVEYAGKDDHEDLVFTALVRVLDIVHDRRFNLGPLVDQYAENRFNYPFATPCLVRSFTRLLEKPTEPDTARKLRATFKVARHILKFITHARGQQKEKEADIGITSSNPGFSRNLRTIFKALDAMMRSNAPVLVGSQTLAVQHFHTWLPELTGLLTPEEILHIAIDFIDSCASVKGKLVLYKLVLIINYSKLDMFSHPEQRSALSANTVRWIAPHWGQTDDVSEQWREQVRLCCSVLASQVGHLGPEIPDYIPKIIDSYLAILAVPHRPKSRRLPLLFPTSYPFPSRPTAEEVSFDEALVELSAVLSAVSDSPSGMQLELADDDLSSVLESTLRVHMSILHGEAFPPDWLSVHIYHHKSTMKTLQYLSSLLLDAFLPDPDQAENFDTELWKLFFTTMLKLVGSSSLALETFPEQKRRAVWKIAGDVREHGAELLRKTWEAIGWETSPDERQRYGLTKLGGYQVQYVPTLVGPIVELCLSVHQGLRRMAVEVLQTMIVSEWTLGEDLSVIQTEVIDCLDLYFKSKPLTESILQKLFVGELLERFEPPLAQARDDDDDDGLHQAVQELMGTVVEFLDLLVAVHGGDGSGAVSGHLINRLRLMEFLRDMQKEDIFVRYVHQLATLQAEARNYTEAGLALRLHADLYDWDPTRSTPALPDPDFPAQSHFERKERIYFDMIKYFEDGKAWSSALAAYKELQTQYETNTFDFSKLARTERAIATVYEMIAKSERLVPKYFKVIFKGLGFPAGARDKAFIYEGSPTERASAFTDRMQEQYPAARIATSEDIDDVEGQFLVVSSISPHRDLGHHVFQRARVPQVIRDYLLSSTLQMFSVSSRRNTGGPVTEHYSEKIVYTTADPFPTILRRSEIVEVQEVRLGAKETALERITRKTQEMTTVERRIADGDATDEAAQLLVDAVSISVNPTSESSVVCYRELVPRQEASEEDEEEEEDDDDDDDDEPELDPQENAIRMALVDHAIMIKRCLATFAKSSNPILLRHVEELQSHFEQTFATEIAIFTPAQPPPQGNITPSPSWARSTPPSVGPSSPQKGRPSPATPIGGGDGVIEEVVSTVQPVALRQGRGARLSFLGGRKGHQQQASQASGDVPNHNHAHHHHPSDGDSETASSRSRSMSNKEHHPARRSSLFRASGIAGSGQANPSANNPKTNVVGTDWAAVPHDGGADRSAAAALDKETAVDGGPARRGSVRKRLSILKLGRKSSRNVLMGSLDEE